MTRYSVMSLAGDVSEQPPSRMTLLHHALHVVRLAVLNQELHQEYRNEEHNRLQVCSAPVQGSKEYRDAPRSRRKRA